MSTYPLSETLGRTMNELSRNRDQEEEVSTSERTIELDDGSYAHEVISRTTPRRRPDTGEEVATVTRRRTSTSSMESGTANTGVLHLQFPTKTVGSISPSIGNSRSNSIGAQSGFSTGSSPQPLPQYQQQMPRSVVGGNSGSSGISPGFVATNSNGVASSSYGNGNWQDINRPAGGGGGGNFRHEPMYDQPYGAGSGNVASPSRGVAWGQTRTTVFEPSRISPLHPQGNYAPLKYVTRRQLRDMRRANQRRALPDRLRSSSVPRLDSLMQEEAMERRRIRRLEGENPGARDFYDPDSLDDIPSSASAAARSSSRHSSAGSRQGSVVGRRAPSISSMRMMPLPTVDGDEYVALFAQSLARIRQVPEIPEPPAYCGAAMQLLLRGTYLVHYGRMPHERYFMLRLLNDELGRQQPYLVWSLHAESATYMDKIHLAHLAGMGRGTSTPRFRRFMVDNNNLRGPFVGDEHSVVPATFSFAFVFQSRQTRRTVETLALDDQTFRCWLLVLDYLANINAGAVEEEYEAETLGPDTPRSQSTATGPSPSSASKNNAPGPRPAEEGGAGADE